jgi:hypothetical protein
MLEHWEGKFPERFAVERKSPFPLPAELFEASASSLMSFVTILLIVFHQ